MQIAQFPAPFLSKFILQPPPLKILIGLSPQALPLLPKPMVSISHIKATVSYR